ncbi:MAG: polyamine aminopropyltransferase [Sulfuricella sp.]|nr:polyamine aminopropyltransferase [Sulfuricella sp.]
MAFFSKRKIFKSVADRNTVDVSEQGGVRSLHLGSDTVQSSMRLSAPNDLELPYTRSMMAFLLFHPEPRDVLMIGVGGGSLVKYVYRYLPGCRTTALEINPQVLAVARSHFFLPPDDERLTVLLEEGAQFVATHPASTDIILSDGFDGITLAEPLSTQLFFSDCRRALRPNGVFAINLWGSDPNFPTYLQRISDSFDGLVLSLPSEKHGNIIVFGFACNQNSPTWESLRERARQLQTRYDLDFLRFVDRLHDLNVYTDKRLLV